MNYFENFPLVWHKLVNVQEDEQVLLPNLTARVMIIQKLKDIEGLLLPYRIQEGETPRSFAERIYGSFELFWINCLINQIMDISKDWPKPEQRVVDELTEKYGLDGMWETKHYLDPQGNITDPLAIKLAYGLDLSTEDNQVVYDYGLTAVSYHDDAIDANEAKRNIQVLDPDYVSTFVSQLEQELSKW